ncbi:hypothetical protein V6N13_061818 [Hibiscus sabdariffa]
MGKVTLCAWVRFPAPHPPSPVDYDTHPGSRGCIACLTIPGRTTTGFVVQEEAFESLSTFWELTKAKKTRLRERNRAADALTLEAISQKKKIF